MGFLKNFFKDVFREDAPQHGSSSFEQLSEAELEKHLAVAQYGDFELTDAIRPSANLEVVPRQGYRHDTYRDTEARTAVPVLMGAASKEQLFEVFMELLDPLGGEVDVVLETSHHRDGRDHVDLYREHIDMPVLKSILWDFEDLLLNDGCTGIAVLNAGTPLEVQFDEHKLLIVYGKELQPFEAVLAERSVPRDDAMKFITEAEHVHSSSEAYYQQFHELTMRLGMDSMCDQGGQWAEGSVQ
ncbi:MAG: hypothetical protein WD176_07840 [Pirellulales bacterium]